MKKIYSLIFISTFFAAHAQYNKKTGADLTNKWSWSLSSSTVDLSNIKCTRSMGIDAEWFMGKHWSLRGGVSIGTDYFKVTTEPFFLYLLAGAPAGESSGSSNRTCHRTRYRPSHHYHSSSRSCGKGAVLLLLILLDSDALCYNIPVSDNLYVSLFASPVQSIYTTSDDKLHLYALAGGGLKYISPGGLVLNASYEFDHSILAARQSTGTKINFSVGYMFR